MARAEVTIWAALNDRPAVEGLRRLTRGFADIKAAGETIGAPIARALEGIERALSDSTKQAIDFQKAVAEVGTVSDRAQWSLGNIAKTADEMSRTFGGSATQNARGLYEVISAGITDSVKATETLTAAQKLAVGGLTDVKTAVDGLTTILNAYQSTGISATSVTDSLFVAVRDGKTRAEELAQSIGLVAPVAASTGISVDELLASIAQLTTQGIRTSTAAEGLRSAISNVIKPTKDAAETAAQLGVEFSVSALQSKGLAGFLNDVVVKSHATQEQLGRLFGDVQGLTAVLALTNDGGTKLNEILGHMTTKAGSTDKAFGAMTETVDFQLSRFDALRDSIARAFGDGLLNAEAFRGGLKAINEELDRAKGGLARSAGEATSVIGGTIATFGASAGAGIADLMGYPAAAASFERYGRAQAQGVMSMFNPPIVSPNADGGTFNMEQQVAAAQSGLGPLAGPFDFAARQDGRPRGGGGGKPPGGGRGSGGEAGRVRGDGALMGQPTVDVYAEVLRGQLADAVPKVKAMLDSASRALFGRSGSDALIEDRQRADLANFWIVSQADKAEGALNSVKGRIASAAQDLQGLLAGNSDTLTHIVADMAGTVTNGFVDLFVGLGDAIGTGKATIDQLLASFAGGIIRTVGIQLIQMGTAALAVSALSFIPFFAGITGPPGMSAAAGAIAIAAGTGLVAAGSALGAAGQGAGASTGAARSSGGSGGSARPPSLGGFTGGTNSPVDMRGRRDAPGALTINVTMGVVGDRRAAATMVYDLVEEAKSRQLGARRGLGG